MDLVFTSLDNPFAFSILIIAFFNLVFLQNLSAFCVGIYTIKINKLGHTPQTSNEGIIAPGILTLLSAILCFGLADKIYY